MSNVIDLTKHLKDKQINNTIDKLNELVRNLNNKTKMDEVKRELEKFHDILMKPLWPMWYRLLNLLLQMM